MKIQKQLLESLIRVCAKEVLAVKATMRQDAIKKRRDNMGWLLQGREDKTEGHITAGL